MSAPRVLVVSHEASRTGVPQVTAHLLRALKGAGFDTVLVQRWGGPMAAELEAASTRSFLEPLAKARALFHSRPQTRKLGWRIGAWAVPHVLKRERPALVICNSVMTTSYATAAVELGIPVLLYSHESRELVNKVVGNARLVETGWVHGDRLTFVGCSTDTAAVFAASLDLPVERVHVLHSPVDVDALVREAKSAPAPPVSGRFVLGCGVGNARKGIDVFNAAATAARAAGRTEQWVWVGQVPESERVAAVTYPGEQPSATPWIAAADVVVLTSRADPFPLVVLEAMALSTPVVASDLAGPREQLGDAGTFVPVGDADGFVAAVAALLEDGARRDAAGAAGAARVAERWDTRAFGEHAVELVRAAIAGGG